jgi:hypothetical protein
MLYSLATLVKNRSTFCLKINKGMEELYNKMQTEHESYEMLYNGIIHLLERNNQFKNIRNEYNSAVGSSDIISEERMEKMESK